MSAQTLNVIYDTNYTNIISDGGFVDHNFTKKLWFFDLLFWSSKDLQQNSASSQNNEQKAQPQYQNLQTPAQDTQAQTQDTQAQWQSEQQVQTGQQTQSEQAQTTQAQPEQANNANPEQKQKSPWFFDLLFGPLNAPHPAKAEEKKNSDSKANESNQTAATQEWQPNPENTQLEQSNSNQQISSNSQENNANQPATTTENTAENITQNHEIAQNDNQTETAQKPKKKSWIDSMLDNVFWTDDGTKKESKSDKKTDEKKWDKEKTSEDDKQLTEEEKKANELREQIKKILEIPDSEYKDSMLTSDMRRFIKKVDEEYTANMTDFKTHIAPSYWEYKWNGMNISGILWKTYYTQRYPTYIDALWTRDLMGMHAKWDMSFFIYPEDDSAMQAMLKRKSTQLKAELNEAISKWVTTDKEVEQQYRDVEMIREKLSTREERYFELSNYFTIYNTDETVLREDWKKFEQKISGYGIAVKTANHRMDEWMTSTLPLCIDDLWITRSAVTSSLAWSFPFISNDLVQNTWIFYGLNLHTWWLIIMDRFSDRLPNMNSVILATSWAWKSFTVKLEILRYLLNWIDIIVIDPENEYKELCEAVGWTYINIATNAQQYINPFDLPPKIEDVEYGKWDLLRSQIMTLIWLIEILVWKLSPEEEAILDKALQNTYALRGFSFEEDDYEWKQPPLMEDLMNVLNGMEWWEQVWLRLSKYATWTFGKLFNNYTNVDINNRITVFSIRDLEDALKTPAMYNVLNFIWTKVRSMKRQRLLVCDEAWIMLQNDVSANFMFSMTKRARKYWLWITTISQDIEDFVRSPYGKPIVSNSSMQILLKQSTTSIKSLNQLLWLSEAEQQKLISCGVWEWLIFAGNQHIALKIVASPSEKEMITTDVKRRSE